MKPEIQKVIEPLAKTDQYEEIRAEALRALGLATNQPGFAVLKQAITNEIVVHHESHVHQGIGDTVHTLRALGKDADPVLVALLTDPDIKMRRTGAAAAGLWPSGGEAVRDALLAVTADRSGNHAQAAAIALSNWPADPAVTALFTKIVSDEKDWGFHRWAVHYLMHALPDDQKNAMLTQAVRAFNGSGNIITLLERGAYDTVKTVVAETKDRIQAGIVIALVRAAADGPADIKKPERMKFAAEMGVLALKNPSTDMHSLGNLFHWFRALGADGAPLLPSLKAMKIEDAGVAKSLTEAIAEIEAKIAAAQKK